ncbi:MarR family winged helix-turn-helix transcriptional regulator [Streptomyces sp. NPDC050560]|uniref:MarR family winged helix-turn-helix transcriptional regulator n=1 Tax=Streptomyces sp. NPDC050560 TaxID=3365630 RepID=UPI0037A19D6A
MDDEAAAGQGAARPTAGELAVLRRLMQVSNAISRGRLSDRAVEATGLVLDRPAVNVLMTLHLAQGAMRVGDIAERMQVVGPHVTRQVQGLERRGLVRRVADPHDRRASLIEPTAEGADAADRYATSMIGWFTDAVADWPDGEREELGRLLGKLADDVTTRLAGLQDTPPAPARRDPSAFRMEEKGEGEERG